jgi:hypothetical protein
LLINAIKDSNSQLDIETKDATLEELRKDFPSLLKLKENGQDKGFNDQQDKDKEQSKVKLPQPNKTRKSKWDKIRGLPNIYIRLYITNNI